MRIRLDRPVLDEKGLKLKKPHSVTESLEKRVEEKRVWYVDKGGTVYPKMPCPEYILTEYEEKRMWCWWLLPIERLPPTKDFYEEDNSHIQYKSQSE